VILASIGARALNRDPEPWLAPDGTRHPRPSAWVPSEAYPDLERVASCTYAPRPEFAPTTTHPANPVLWDLRTSGDSGDPWGTYLAWGIATAAAAEWLDVPVPERMGWHAGAGGAEGVLTDGSFEAWMLLSGLDLLDPSSPDMGDAHDRPVLADLDEVAPFTLEFAAAAVAHALAVLDRLLEAVPEEDRY
jgi:hypothetical protein